MTVADGRRRFCRAWLGGTPLALLAACAQPERRSGAGAAHWSGRLQLRVQDPDAPQSFAAHFELHGSAQQGTLDLSSPLGTTLARLQWHPGQARLETSGRQRTAASLQALLQEVTPAPLPVEALFDWLAGVATAASGWEVDLQALSQGRLSARRTAPAPAALLRILLD